MMLRRSRRGRSWAEVRTRASTEPPHRHEKPSLLRAGGRRFPLEVALGLILLFLTGWVQGAKVRGTVTSNPDGLPLPGVEVSLEAGDGAVAGETLSNEAGEYEIVDVAPGRYRLVARIPGFESFVKNGVDMTPGAVFVIDIGLDVAAPDERIVVVAKTTDVTETATSGGRLAAELVNVVPVQGDDFRDLLPLLPGVIRSTDGRIIMKGGDATQSSTVVNSSTNATDPSTGNLGFSLPSDAIDEIEVLSNPYAAEFGRFSSGITNILTRQGTDKWHFTINNFFPRAKFRDGTLMGIGGFTPRIGIRGPLIKDRIFVAQTVQYRFIRTRVDGQPDLHNDKHLESFDSFTQFDLNLGTRHNLTAAVSVFPSKFDFINLDTFNPQEVTANLHQRGYSVGLSERWAITPTALLESTVSMKRFDADVFGNGHEEMFVTPEGNEGSFFNSQQRKTRTLQVVESLTLAREGGGSHLFKFGVDMLHSTFDGASQSRPVNIIRSDGSLGEQIAFGDPTAQRIRSTDVAIYGQDQWKVHERVLFEFGGRLDRDGVLEKTHFAPRTGLVFSLFPESGGVLRGGAGLFYDRTPLNVGAFTSYEPRRVIRFGADGETPLDMTQYTHRNAPGLNTPYSFTWNIEYDQKVGERWAFKGNYLRRNGFREFLVDIEDEPDAYLRLDSRGRSRYWELEFTGRYMPNKDSYVMLSYVHSRAERDLNSFDNFFGNIRYPVIRGNEYSLADIDVPHRFLFQGTIVTWGDWIISPVVEVRSGFPYSLLNETQEFVGPRNLGGRFPWLHTIDLDVQKWFKLWKWNTRIGFRVFNLLGTFNPRNVQGNLDSSGFGVFSNTIDRRFGLNFQIEN